MKNTVFTFLLLVSFSINAQNLNNGLIAKFLFNGNLADSSSFQNHLTSTYATYQAVQDRFGDVGKAMSIKQSNSLNNYFYTDLSIPQYNITDSFSISFWTNFSHYPLVGDILYYGSLDGTIKNYSVYFDSYISFDGNTFWDSAVNREEWHHFVLTYKQGVANLFVNGNKSPFSFSNTNIGNTADQKLVIGKIESVDINAEGFIGYYDDIYLYNRILSQQEVNLLYDINTVTTNHLSVSNLNLFYNSSTQQLVSETEMNSIFIYNSMGQQVISNQNINSLDVSNLKPGVYLVKSLSNSNQLMSLKFIKK